MARKDLENKQNALDFRKAANDNFVELYDKDVALEQADAIETAAREAADTTLQTNIDNEATARTNADNALQSNIDAVAADLDTEEAARANADTTLQTNIDNEATARTNADNTLQSNIDAVAGNLSTEETARANADTTLQNNINSEAQARSDADTTLQNNINAEETARENADTTLQNNITSEQESRENADANLQSQINDHSADIQTINENKADKTWVLGMQLDDLLLGTADENTVPTASPTPGSYYIYDGVAGDLPNFSLTGVNKQDKLYYINNSWVLNESGLAAQIAALEADVEEKVQVRLPHLSQALSHIRKAEKRAEADGATIDPTNGGGIIAKLIELGLWNEVSLCLVPGMFKAGKSYAVKPKSGDGDFTVTRASTATRVNEEGEIEEVAINVPRVDYSDGEPKLLIESQRTNDRLYSEDFTQPQWTKTNVTVGAGVAFPFASKTSNKIIEDANTGLHVIGQNKAFVTGDNYTLSVYAKKGERSIMYMGAGNPNTWAAAAYFNLETGEVGTITAGSAEIEELKNGWYRCVVSGIALADASTNLLAGPVESDGNANYTGDGVSGIYTFGMQLEKGSYLTSYIPTSGSAVTRSTDGLFSENLTEILEDEYTIYVDFEKGQTDGVSDNLLFSLRNQGDVQQYRLEHNRNNLVRVYYDKDTTYPFGQGGSATSGKIIWSYDGVKMTGALNGELSNEYNINTPSDQIKRIVVRLNNHTITIKSIVFIKGVVSDSDKIQLTK